MTSLIVPIGFWSRAPSCAISCVVSGRNYVVTGSSSGLIISWSLADIADIAHGGLGDMAESASLLENGREGFLEDGDDKKKPRPIHALIGHTASISAMLIGSMCVDETVTDTLISASVDGTIGLWDLGGRSLQSNCAGFDGIPSWIGLTPHYIVVTGSGMGISLLDRSSLDLVKVIPVLSWIPKMCLVESSVESRFILITADHILHWARLDDKGSIRMELGNTLPSSSQGTCLDIAVSTFDPNIFLVLTRHSCLIYTTKETSGCLDDRGPFFLLSQIDCPSAQKGWAGAAFQSARTILAWTAQSSAFFFFLGPESLLLNCPISLYPSHKLGSSQIVIADSQKVIYTNETRPDYRDYKIPTCTAMFSGSSLPSKVCLLSSPSHSSLIAFERDPIHGILIQSFSYWITTLPVSKAIIPHSPGLNAIVFHPIPESSVQLEKIWPCGGLSLFQITVATVVLKKFIAIGQENGDILIIPISAPMVSTPPTIFQRLSGHRTCITALFVPDLLESGLRKRLVSGSLDGVVKLWNAETGSLIGSFCNHSRAVWSFVQLPSEIGSRVDTTVMSLSRDGSISILDVNDGVCLYRFHGHLFDVQSVHWKPEDDLMMVYCVDGSLYVWEVSTF